ncbi:hypothetical protein H5410_049300, partial [Solanum commersonii]
MEPVGPHGQNDPFSRSNESWSRTSVKTFPMDLVVPHGQNGPFSRVNDPRSRISTSFFPKFYLDIRKDLTYGANWPSLPKRPIFKVERSLNHTLPMEPDGPHVQNVPFQGQMIPRTDLTYRASWPSRPKQSILKVNDPRAVYGMFGDPAFRPHFCKKFTWTSVKTLPMEPVGLHGHNGPFSKSNNPRSSDGASWPSRPKGPIFKVKRFAEQTFVKNLLWSQLDLTTKTAHSQCQRILGAAKPPILLIFVTLRMETVGPHGQNGPFSRSNNPQSSQWNFRDPEYRPHFGQNFTWTFVNAFSIEPVVSDSQNGPFSRLNHPRSSILPGRTLGTYLRSQLALTAKASHFQGQTIPGAVGPHGQNDPFLKSSDPRSNYGASWPSQPKGPILKVKRSAKQDPAYGANWSSSPKRPILKVKQSPQQTLLMEPVGPHSQNNPFSRSNDPQSSTWNFCDPEFRSHFCKSFTWTSVRTLPMEPVGPNGQNIPFSRANDPRSNWTFVETLAGEPVGLHGQKGPFSRSIDLQSSCPSWPKRPIFKIKRSPEQVNPHFDDFYFTYGANWPSRPKRSIFKVERSPKQSMDFLVIWNSDLIYAKILPGRQLRPYLWSQLALTAKTSHFQGQMIPRTDLTYRASWPSRPKQLIFKTSPIEPVGPHSQNDAFSRSNESWSRTSVKTFPMDLVVPHGQNDPFSRVNDPRSRTSVKTFPMELVVPHKQNSPFSRLNDPQSRVNGIFGVLEFRPHFFQNFTWLSIKTLPMEPIGPHGQNDPFSRSNDPRIRPYLWSQMALMSKTSHFRGQMIPRTGKPPIMPIFTLPIELVGPHGQNDRFSRSNDPWSRPYLWIRLALTAKMAHFKIKRSLEQNFDLIFAKILPERLLRPYLWSQLALMAKTAHYHGQTIKANPTFCRFLCAINPDFIFAKILPRRMLRPYLWSQLSLTAKSARFKVKRSPKQSMEFLVILNFDLIFAKILLGRPLNLYLWSQLALTAKMDHFKNQTIPGEVHGFFGYPEFQSHFCKILPGRPLRPYLWSQLSPLAKMAHFQGQMIPGEDLPMDPVGAHGLNSPFSRSNNPRNLPIEQLALTAIMARFESQTIPGVEFSSGASWPSRPKDPIFMVKRFAEQELINGARWPSSPKRPIFKVKRSPEQTLAMEPVGPQGQKGPFSRSNNLRSRNLPTKPVGPHLQNVPFSRSNDHRSSWMFVKNLAMEPVGLNGQKGPFSRSNDLRSRANWPLPPTRPIFKVKRSPEQNLLWRKLGLTTKTAYLKCQTILGADLPYRASWPSRPKLPISNVKRSSEQNYDLIFAKILPIRPLRPYLWCQFALTAKTTHFVGQMIPGAVNGIFGDPEFRPHFCQIFTSTTVRTLPMEPIGPHSQNGPFSRSKDPWSRPYLWSQLGLSAIMAHFQSQTNFGVVLTYERLSLRRPKGPFSVLQPHFDNILPGRPLRPYLLTQMVLTAKTSHFQCQIIPEARKPRLPILDLTMEQLAFTAKWPIFKNQTIRTLAMERLALRPKGPIFRSSDLAGETLAMERLAFRGGAHFKVKRCEAGPCLWSDWSSPPKRPILKVKRSRKGKPRFADFRCAAIVHGFFDDQNLDLILPKFYLGVVKTLHMELVGPHGQNNPIFKVKAIPGVHGIFVIRIQFSFCKFLRASIRTLPMERLALADKASIFRSNDPGQVNPSLSGYIFRCAIVNGIFGCPKLRSRFSQNFTWTSSKTLPMEPLGPRNQKRPILKVKANREPYLWSQLALTAKSSHFQGQMIPGAVGSIKTLHMERLAFRGQKDFSRSNDPQARTLPMERISPTRIPFQVKAIPKKVNPFFFDFRCAIVHGIFGDRIFNHFLPKFYGRPLRPYHGAVSPWPKRPIFQGQAIPQAGRLAPRPKGPFSRSNDPGSETLPMEPVGPHGSNALFSRLNDPGATSFLQNFYGRPLRPYLWSELALAAKSDHFNFSDPERPLRLCLWNGWTSAKTTYFQGQNDPEK